MSKEKEPEMEASCQKKIKLRIKNAETQAFEWSREQTSRLQNSWKFTAAYTTLSAKSD